MAQPGPYATEEAVCSTAHHVVAHRDTLDVRQASVAADRWPKSSTGRSPFAQQVPRTRFPSCLFLRRKMSTLIIVAFVAKAGEREQTAAVTVKYLNVKHFRSSPYIEASTGGVGPNRHTGWAGPHGEGSSRVWAVGYPGSGAGTFFEAGAKFETCRGCARATGKIRARTGHHSVTGVFDFAALITGTALVACLEVSFISDEVSKRSAMMHVQGSASEGEPA